MTAIEKRIREQFTKDGINFDTDYIDDNFSSVMESIEVVFKQQIIDAYLHPDDLRGELSKMTKRERAEQYYNSLKEKE